MSTLRSLLALAAVTASSSVLADTVNMTGFTYTPAKTVTVGAPNYSGAAGQFSGTWDGNSFEALCVEITQSIILGSNVAYSAVSAASAFGATKAADLSRLFTAGAGFITDASTSAAFQAAVWEVVYEGGGGYDLTSGGFTGAAKYAGDAPTVAAFSAVNALLMNLGSYAPSYKVTVLASRESQDLVTAGPVPEPATYAMLLAGLAGIGFVARRRAK